MLNIDRALSLYSEKLANGEYVDIDSYCLELQEGEQEEFMELAEIVQLTMQLNKSQEFELFFDELDTYKESVYNYNKVANFSSEKGIQGNTDIVDKLFEEEFNGED